MKEIRQLLCLAEELLAGNSKLYHGTSQDFNKLKLNGLGILWLTPNPRAAVQYASKSYNKNKPAFLWTVELKPSAKILDLDDLSQPLIREVFESLRDVSQSMLSRFTEETWAERADFGLLEWQNWIVRFLKSKRIDGVYCKDKVDTLDVRHPSVALFRLSAIESSDRSVVEKGPDMLGDIDRDVNGWKP